MATLLCRDILGDFPGHNSLCDRDNMLGIGETIKNLQYEKEQIYQ
ncbi:hypothetical protein Xmau_02033 [Xenorhabdus mauleonii]|uniref:Uncharacterized protein n=1 Tax=Xenorhabdus mauleonii TaxID=351675 RepID=A0A1I3HU13_9GAMM|nr:hypothetical protein Xmau_02033 [Xenorhabdus mauleonii]SFI39057.1 hypothetical protein SAMN05421680_10164 [Xenorhabdus mauleonii]